MERVGGWNGPYGKVGYGADAHTYLLHGILVSQSQTDVSKDNSSMNNQYVTGSNLPFSREESNISDQSQNLGMRAYLFVGNNSVDLSRTALRLGLHLPYANGRSFSFCEMRHSSASASKRRGMWGAVAAQLRKRTHRRRFGNSRRHTFKLYRVQQAPIPYSNELVNSPFGPLLLD